MRILSVSRGYQGTITESGKKHTRSKIVRFTQGLLKLKKQVGVLTAKCVLVCCHPGLCAKVCRSKIPFEVQHVTMWAARRQFTAPTKKLTTNKGPEG